MTTAAAANPFDPHLLGLEVYVHLCPLVIMETTRRQMTNDGRLPSRGPAQLQHLVRRGVA